MTLRMYNGAVLQSKQDLNLELQTVSCISKTFLTQTVKSLEPLGLNMLMLLIHSFDLLIIIHTPLFPSCTFKQHVLKNSVFHFKTMAKGEAVVGFGANCSTWQNK